MDPCKFIWKSPVLGLKGCVSCDQPLASVIGLDILHQGGSAADAAIAMAAAVSVGYPTHCGIGGDCNILYYRASDKSVLSINGSGRSGKRLTLQKVLDAGFSADSVFSSQHGLFITVPGAVSGIFNCFRHFGSGKLSMVELLGPAITLAENGIPLSPKVAEKWKNGFQNVKYSRNSEDFLVDGRVPSSGDIVKIPKLAECLRSLSTRGVEEFYKGGIAQRIVAEVQNSGGVLTMDDMRHHLDLNMSSLPTDPVCIEFHGYNIWETALNTIGIVALVALNLLKGYNLKDLGHNTAEYIHLVAEVVTLAYNDCWNFLCDPDFQSASYKYFLTEEYAENRRNDISFSEHTKMESHCKEFLACGNTSYLTAVDSDGNACSFIFSLGGTFGSGCIPQDSGFVLHDRGKCFSFDEKSPNCFGPRKLPAHTIIPAIVTDRDTGDFVASLGVVGRWTQPQGHVQVLLNMLVFGMDPQMALDQPRFSIGDNKKYTSFIDSTDILNVETGISEEVAAALQKKGHVVVRTSDAAVLGRGHVIAKQKLWSGKTSETLWAGCDRRSDGITLAF